ncbi:MAG: hypothetical protein ACK4GT_17945 [Pararhodobacter sp.]
MLLTAGFAGSAWAMPACDLAVSRVDSLPISVDPFEARPRAAPVSVEVRNDSEEECAGILSLADAIGGSPDRIVRSGVGLSFRERASTVGGGAGSLAARDIRVPARSSRSFTFAPVLTIDGVPSRGPRRFELSARVQTPASPDAAETGFDLNIDVPASTRVTVAGLPADRTIHLGDLSQGGQGRATLYMQSNGPYMVSVRSMNQGRMVHQTDPGLPSIDYQLMFDGRASSLAAPVQVFRDSQTPMLGDQSVLLFTAAAGILAYAGTYKDVIEVEVSPY